jgi:hypothetical protein
LKGKGIEIMERKVCYSGDSVKEEPIIKTQQLYTPKGNEFLSVIRYGQGLDWTDLCELKQISSFNRKTGELIIHDKELYEDYRDSELMDDLTCR